MEGTEPREGIALPAATAIVLLGTAALAAALAVVHDRTTVAAFSHGVRLLTVAFAAVMFVRKAALGPHGAVWGRLAAAMVAFALAEGYWFVVHVVMARPLSSLSVVQAFDVIGYGLLLAALFGSVPSRWSRWLQARVALDAVVVSASLLAIAWVVFGRGMADADQPGVARLVASAYPALDLALLAALLFLLRAVRGVHRPRVLLFGLGLLLWTAVDVAYAAQVADEGFRSGLSVDALRTGGYVAFALAAVVRPGAAVTGRHGVPAKAWANAIYVPLAVLVPVAVVDYWMTRMMDPALFGTGVVLVAALTGRQVLFTREVREAHEHLRQQAAALEDAQAIAHVGSWEYDLRSRRLNVSKEIGRIFAMDPYEASYDAIMAHVHPDDIERVEKAFFESVENGRPFAEEHRIVVGGRTRHVAHHGATEYEGDTPVRSVGTVQDVTERRHAEEQRRFQAHLLASVGQTVVATDLDGRITYWNAAAEQMYGWTREEVMGKDAAELVPTPSSRDEALAAREALRAGGSWSGELAVRDKAGREFLVESRVTAVMDVDGRPTDFISVAQDVTARKQMESALQERVKELRALSAIATEMATVSDIRSVLQVVVAALEPAFLHGDTWVRVQVGDQIATSAGAAPEDDVLHADFDAGEAEGRVEVRYREVHGRQEIGPFLQEEQDLLHAVAGLLASGVRRVEAQEAVHQREEALGEAQRIARLGSWTWDPATDATTWSDMMYTIFERDPGLGPAGIEEALAMFAPESRRALQAALDDVVAEGIAYELDLEVVLPSGAKHVVSRGEAVCEADEVALLRGTVQDITQRKEAEKARLENQYLKELDRRLRDFINAAAHDLSQPLTPMRISLESLEDFLEDVPDAPHRTVEILQRNVDRMALLLQDLLDVARLESGTLNFDVDDRGLAPILQETEEFFERQATEAGVTLQIDIEAGVRVMADPRRVIQVLFNLVGNALKFTPSGGRITIRGRPDDGVAVVEVVDTGSGLKPEQMDRLFEAFSQVHTPSADVPRGTGLGLYISRGIVAKHGGEIGVDSEGPGKGSTFWFTLPLVE